MGKIYKPLSKTVKETIDSVFELTTSNPGGYEMKAKDLGRTGQLVVRVLANRGILERTRVKGKTHSFLYKWVAASAPTNVLYGSVTQELGDNARKQNERYYTKKRTAKKTASVDEIAEGPDISTFQDSKVSIVAPAMPLDPFSSQELWDELKRRGFFIEGDRICIVKKAYLE